MLFNYLDFETVSNCNRTCPTCIRNSHPDREAVAPWFETRFLPEVVIYQAIEEALAMGFRGGICLSHYSEPLMDERIPAIARRVKEVGQRIGGFSRVFLNSNGDFLTEAMAHDLDGALDRIIITLYMDEPVKSRRAEWMTGLFDKTELVLITKPVHIATHFSPAYDVVKLARENSGHGCSEPAMRVIINHRRQYLLCCDDVVGTFGLGTFPELPLAEYWNGAHADIQARLAVAGGRSWHAHCMTCPRL